jgi:uncharacterized protein YjbJ (UPF0337 family)
MNKITHDKIEEVIDPKVGAGTTDKLQGTAKVALGKAQQKVGEALDNPELEAYGLVNEHEGELQHKRGELKEEVETLTERTKELLHDVADAVREKAHYAVEKIKKEI